MTEASNYHTSKYFYHFLLKESGAKFKKIMFSFDSLQTQFYKLAFVTLLDSRASRRQVDFRKEFNIRKCVCQNKPKVV